MPSHAHTIGYQKYGKPSGSTDWLVQASWSAAPYTSTVSNTGSGQAHDHSMAHTHTVNTLPPYIAVYMWRRTA